VPAVAPLARRVRNALPCGPMGSLLVFLAMEVLAFYLLFVGGSWSGLYEWTIRAASVALALAVAAAWAVVAWRRPAWRPRSVLLPAIGLALGSLALSTALSRAPRLSVEYLGYAVLLAGGYLLLVRLMASDRLRARMQALVVVLALAVPGLYVFSVGIQWLTWWGNVGRPAVPPLRPDSVGLTFGNPSAVLTVAFLLAGPAVAIVAGRRRGILPFAVVLTLGLAFVTLVTGSRGGWVGLGLAIPATAGLWLASGGHWRMAIATARGLGRRGTAALGALALAVAAGGVALGPVLLRRLSDGGTDLRLNYIKAALRMFAEAPLAGTGPGTWVAQRIRYTVPPETDYYIPHAHDVYAQTLAELGLVGVAVGVAVIAAVAWLIRDGIRDADAGRRRWAWAAAFGLLYLAAHQLLDFYMNFPGVLFLAAIPVAYLDATASRAPAVPRPIRWPVALPGRLAAGALVLAVVIGAGLGWSESVAATSETAVLATIRGDWAAADPLARDAASRDPAQPVYLFDAGLTAAHAGDHAAAADYLRRAVDLDPLPVALVDLAAEEVLLGRADDARTHLEAAAGLGLQRPAVAMAAGELAARLGMDDLAMDGYAAALAGLPSLAADPWWATAGRPGPALIDIVGRAETRATPDVAWQIGLFGGSTPARLRELAAADATSYGGLTAWDVVQAYLDPTGDAARAVFAAADAHPLDWQLATWAERLAFAAHDDATGYRYGRIAQTVSGAFVGGLDVRVVPSDEWRQGLAELYPIFWGPYTYRRWSARDMLVPSLVHVNVVVPTMAS
jgi:O-antigen ligase